MCYSLYLVYLLESCFDVISEIVWVPIMSVKDDALDAIGVSQKPKLMIAVTQETVKV